MENVEETGGRMVRFSYEGVFEELLDKLGEMPLPPYIHEKLADQNRYQTVYAKSEGSAAAPTAGLHFTPELLEKVRQKGVTIVPVPLHVGLGTFRPVKEVDVDKHVMHSEFYQVTKEAADTLNRIRAAGGRLVCVGTTSVRTIETVADDDGVIHAGSGETAIFIKPGVKIKAVDALITNFHLPQSTLVMLVSTFVGRERTLDAYRLAVQEKHRLLQLRGRDVHRIRGPLRKGLLMLKTLAEMAATIAAVPLYIHYLPGIACADMEAALSGLRAGAALSAPASAGTVSDRVAELSVAGTQQYFGGRRTRHALRRTHEEKLLGRGLPLCPVACSYDQRCPDASGRTVQKEEITEVQP